ncbi:unnamed protein product [Spirodela intermedia]|uniref:TCP domain-containing protein n=2 Tax=Spirodela intermedia TaxID=51605 RepID=A0A7I8IHQ2_SPIIN|nr:unnamed protein product [Spirodela intermedia]CAA6657372.1 unnamed protein product [Spirodela intermedia]CAA7393426.1 unnamed protein product [Spirodela intermedia]
MIRNPREKAPSTKQEEEAPPGDGDSGRGSSRPWPAALRDTRVVRGSRVNGGKDRHSKVTTARGLRDRRVRLSVQTAIQLYDLQDRLGLNQPSKAVDWLLDAAQHEIDKLPPLQIPLGSSLLYHNPPIPAQFAMPEKEDLQNPYPGYYLMEPPLPPNAAGGNVAAQEEAQSFYRHPSLQPTVAPPPSLPLSLSHGSQLLLSMFSPYPAAAASSEYDPRHVNGGFEMGSSSGSQGSKHHRF